MCAGGRVLTLLWIPTTTTPLWYIKNNFVSLCFLVVYSLKDLHCQIIVHFWKFLSLKTWAQFLFLLTDVSLSVTLSETHWKVATVSEGLPHSVLINHPQLLYSPLSLWDRRVCLSNFVPFTAYLSLLPFLPCHSLSLFCHSLSLHLLSPFCLSVFISLSCQSFCPFPTISHSNVSALIVSFLFPHSLSILQCLFRTSYQC